MTSLYDRNVYVQVPVTVTRYVDYSDKTTNWACAVILGVLTTLHQTGMGRKKIDGGVMADWWVQISVRYNIYRKSCIVLLCSTSILLLLVEHQ